MEYKRIHIETIPADNCGALSFFEGEKTLPFAIRRIYYISGVPQNGQRGFHAHKRLKQFLFCPYGSILLTLDNGSERETIRLNAPDVGIYIDTPTWREMTWETENAVLVVAASEYYDESDYIRDYSDYLAYIAQTNIAAGGH